jgi:N-acetylmuramoyl-L-alanine amidase
MLSRLGRLRLPLGIGVAVAVAAAWALLSAGEGADTVPGDGPTETAAITYASEGTAGSVPEVAASVSGTEFPRSASEPVTRTWRRIVLDAGHGGADTGAAGVSGALEKEVTLGVARGCARALRKLGFEVIETRVSDVAVRLERRSGAANAQGAGVFVSIHANSASREAVAGIETYYMDLSSDEAASRLAERENRARSVAGDPSSDSVETIVADLQMGAYAKQSRALAIKVHRQLVSGLREFYGGDRVSDRGVRTAPFWVLLDSQMPAVLIELGYLTNPAEERRLRTHGYQRQAAQAIATAIAEFVEHAEAADPAQATGVVQRPAAEVQGDVAR